MKGPEGSIIKGRKKFVWLYIIIAVVFVTSAYFYYRYEEADLIKQKQSELASIAKLKISQISKWYDDEKVDAELISHNTLLIKEIQKALLTGDQNAHKKLTEVLQQIKVEHDYADIIITTPDAEIITSTNPFIKKLNSNLSQKIFETANKSKIIELDFFRSKSFGDKILLGFIAPIITEENRQRVTITFLIHPEDNIYQLTKLWPVPTVSSETLLFRVDGDSILYMNELRHRKNTALKFVLPKSLSDLPAAKAAEGYTGIYRGEDYRKVKVVAYVSEIPKTNWYLVSKVDEEELFAGLMPKMVMTGFIVLLLMVITGIGLYLIYSYHQHSLTKSLYKKEKELWRQQEKFKVTMESLGQGVITLNVDGKVQYMNKMAENLTGWMLRNARGRDLHEVYPVKNEQTGLRENNILDEIFKHGVVKELANHTVLITKDGNEIPLMDTGAPIYDNDGTILGVSIVFQDETERREQEKRIKESEARLRTTLDNLIEGCQIIDYDYKYLYLNKAALESSRKTSEELIGETMMECYPEIENTEMFRKLKGCMETREAANIENEFIYPDGQKRIFNLRFEPVPEGLFILSEDITDLKSTQDIIKKFRMGIELSGDAIFLTAKDGTITYVNPAFEKIFGYTEKEVLGKTPRILKSGTLTEEYYESFWSKLLSNKPVTHEIINKTKDGRLIYLEASITPINNEAGEIIGYLAIERDVTERKLAEERREQLTAIIEATPDFVGIADTNGNSIFVNNAGKKMLGFEVVYDSTKIKIPDCHPAWARDIVLNEGLPTAAREGTWIGETALLHRDGFETPISQIIIAHKTEDGEVKYFSTVGRDITERKQYEKKLIENEEFLSTLFNSVHDAIFTVSMSDRTIHKINKAVVNLFGYNHDEIIGKRTNVLYPSEEAYLQFGKMLSEAKNENKHDVRTELKFLRKDKTEVYCDVQTTFLNEAGKDDLVISVLRDVTEKREMINELIAAKEKAEVMNEVKTIFFANMSHELRTPFVGIMGYADLLYEELEDPEQKEMAEGILSTSNRMMETLTKILKYSKMQIKDTEINHEEVDITGLINSIHKNFLPVAKKKNLIFDKILHTGSMKIISDEDLLTDILNNLVSNALNYTNEGSVTIELTSKIKSGKNILAISVSDTGIGIPKDKHDIIWHEFRQVSEGRSRDYQGTGLGLAITKKYTELLGGKISLESDEDKGSTFILELPVDPGN